MKSLKILFISILSSTLTLAQSAGPNVPSTYSVSGTGASWGNLIGVVAVDNSPAYADLAQYPTCNNFMCYYSNVASFTGFGFTIPTTSTITGIQLNILQRVSSPGGGIHDSSLVLSIGGIQYGSDYANDSNWFDTPIVRTYGGSADTWGYAWTPTEINDPTFGILYRLTNLSYDQPGSVDHLTMTVYYQAGTGIFSQTSVPWQISVSNNNLLISGSLNNAKESCEVEVSDIIGKIVYRKQIEPVNNVIYSQTDVSSWTKGTYIVKVSKGSGVITRKITLAK